MSAINSSISRAFVAAALVFMLGAPGRLALYAQPGPTAVLLDVPAIKQPHNMCLAACISMVLRYWGADITPRSLADRVPIYRDGIAGQDVQPLIERMGFRSFLIQPPFGDLLEHLRKGRPPVVEFPARGGGRHAMVLVGFDEAKQDLFLMDPASGKRRSFDYKTFQQKWEEAQRWTFLIVPK